MKILGIESSCDDTSIALLECKQDSCLVLSESTISQIDIHKKYGGVYPALAKREHTSNLFPIFFQSLKKAKLLVKRKNKKKISKKLKKKIEKIFERDQYNKNLLIDFCQNYQKPKIKAVAVTYGPGLEIAL